MTALEAYALAKKIAISAVSGIKNLSVNGTTLTIETNDGNSLDMVFPTPADGRGIKNTTINENNHLIITYDDDTTEDAGLIKGSDVQVAQILDEGIKIASIKVDGNITDIFAPRNGGGGTSNYSALTNKPSINEVILDGNKTAADLGLDASNLIDNSTLVVNENGKIAIGEVSNDDIASLFL